MAQKSKNNNKMNMNMPRPSMLWIYGLIGLFIIGWYLFDGSNEAPLPSDWTTVQEMVEKGDVEKIQVVNRDQAQVFLKKEAGEKYRNDSVDKRFRRLPESGVQLTLTIGSVDSFREDLKAAEEKSGQTVPVIYENKANDWTSILINLLPWVLIIGVWIFIMRSMSRGAGGGAGGLQLFGIAGELQQVPGAEPGIVLLEAVGVGQQADALAGVEPEVMAAVNAAVEVIPQKAQGDGPVAIGAGLGRLVLVLVHWRGTAAFFQLIGGLLKEIQKWNGHTMHLTLR